MRGRGWAGDRRCSSRRSDADPISQSSQDEDNPGLDKVDTLFSKEKSAILLHCQKSISSLVRLL